MCHANMQDATSNDVTVIHTERHGVLLLLLHTAVSTCTSCSAEPNQNPMVMHAQLHSTGGISISISRACFHSQPFCSGPAFSAASTPHGSKPIRAKSDTHTNCFLDRVKQAMQYPRNINAPTTYSAQRGKHVQ